MSSRVSTFFLLVTLVTACTNSGEFPTIVSPIDIYDSGGELLPEQAAMDITYYDLGLEIKPEEKWIGGSLATKFQAKENMDLVVLQLDTLLAVSEILDKKGNPLSWQRQTGLLLIKPLSPIKKGEFYTVEVFYSGSPKSVENPQRGGWADGFFWEKTEDGSPWVGNVSVLDGADIWWPCKDHPSDETDSMAIRITVPEPLKVASNGSLREVVPNSDGTKTYNWFVSTPINNYSVTVNIAPYVQIDTVFQSIAGETFPFSFWATPEHEELARNQFPHFVENMQFLEQLLGPYPFRADKYGSAETFYLGMENQTIIAYGSSFDLNEWGFDWLHFHELTHEWFASLVTAEDWKHWWVHEGITSYIESLYAEHLAGGDESVYLAYMRNTMSRVRNEIPVVIDSSAISTREGYHGDVYSKGASIMHTLRYVLGKEKTIDLLRDMLYPNETARSTTDGSHVRQATTEELIERASSTYGEDLNWFFQPYLYYADVPQLVSESLEDRVLLRWETGSGEPFPLNVPVKIGEDIITVNMENGEGEFSPEGQEYQIDPEGRILKEVLPLEN